MFSNIHDLELMHLADLLSSYCLTFKQKLKIQRKSIGAILIVSQSGVTRFSKKFHFTND